MNRDSQRFQFGQMSFKRFAVAGMLCSVLAIGLVSLAISQDAKTLPSATTEATQFLAMLSEAEKAKCLLPYDTDQRVGWHFIPLDNRKGLPLMEMTSEQQTAAKELLGALVSQYGKERTDQVMLLEGILRKLEGPGSEAKRNPEKYYFTVFGEPNSKSTWGVSIEGHHLSLNFSLDGDQVVDSTPQFIGANPAELKADFGDDFVAGFRLLKAEEQSGFELLAALTEEQRKSAWVAKDAPDEIRWAGEPQAKPESAQGIAVSKLTETQVRLVKQLLESYMDSMRSDVAEERWAKIEQNGFEKIHFAWAGADKPGVGHYYCVQGDSFIIEFINVQADAEGNPANHIHCVWRDLTGDFNQEPAAR